MVVDSKTFIYAEYESLACEFRHCIVGPTAHTALRHTDIEWSSRRLSNSLRPRKNGRYFADEIFVNENCCILIQMSLKYVRNGPINNISSLLLFQIMVWRLTKSLSESMTA